MPKYLVLSADALDGATIIEANVSNPSDAVQALDPGRPDYERFAVIPCDEITQVLLVGRSESDVVIVNREAGVAPVTIQQDGQVIQAQVEEAPVEIPVEVEEPLVEEEPAEPQPE